MVEQTDHFAHLELFDQDIIFHFDPSYRQEKGPGFYSFLVPEESDFKRVFDQCNGLEFVRPLRTLSGHVVQQTFSIRGVSGHELEFKYYLPMAFQMNQVEE